MRLFPFFLVAIFSLSHMRVFAVSPVGKVEKLNGVLLAFSQPETTLEALAVADRETRVQYDGQFWKAKELKEGDEVFLRDVLQCHNSCKAKIKLHSGSQLLISSASRLMIGDQYLKTKDPSFFELFSGALRAIIVKQHEQPEFRSGSSVLGVRGTDFFFGKDDHEQTKVSVLEGEVGVKTVILGVSSEVIPVKKGLSLSVPQATVADIEEIKKLPPAEQKAKVAALSTQKPTPISLQEIQEIKSVGSGLDKLADRRVAAVEKKLSPASSIDFGTLKLVFEGNRSLPFSVQGCSSKGAGYALFGQVAEYQPPSSAFGLGLYLSEWMFDKTLFLDRSLVPFSSIDASAVQLRLFAEFADIRFGMDGIIGGAVALRAPNYKKSYDIGGFSLHAARDFEVFGPLQVRTRFALRSLKMNYPGEKAIKIIGIELGVGALLKF